MKSFNKMANILLADGFCSKAKGLLTENGKTITSFSKYVKKENFLGDVNIFLGECVYERITWLSWNNCEEDGVDFKKIRMRRDNSYFYPHLDTCLDIFDVTYDRMRTNVQVVDLEIKSVSVFMHVYFSS